MIAISTKSHNKLELSYNPVLEKLSSKNSFIPSPKTSIYIAKENNDIDRQA